MTAVDEKYTAPAPIKRMQNRRVNKVKTHIHYAIRSTPHKSHQYSMKFIGFPESSTAFYCPILFIVILELIAFEWR